MFPKKLLPTCSNLFNWTWIIPTFWSCKEESPRFLTWNLPRSFPWSKRLLGQGCLRIRRRLPWPPSPRKKRSLKKFKQFIFLPPFFPGLLNLNPLLSLSSFAFFFDLATSWRNHPQVWKTPKGENHVLRLSENWGGGWAPEEVLRCLWLSECTGTFDWFTKGSHPHP